MNEQGQREGIASTRAKLQKKYADLGSYRKLAQDVNREYGITTSAPALRRFVLGGSPPKALAAKIRRKRHRRALAFSSKSAADLVGRRLQAKATLLQWGDALAALDDTAWSALVDLVKPQGGESPRPGVGAGK